MIQKGQVRKIEILDTGLYTLREAARLAKTSPITLRRWLMGYRFPTRWRGGRSEPVFSPQLPEVEGHVALGFLDLIEILFIKAFRNYGVTLPTIRRAAKEAARRWNTSHPFCIKKFRTDGHSVFANIEWEDGDRGLIDLAKSQLAFERVLDPYLEQIDYDLSGEVSRWWPLGKKRAVILDPRYCFGKPIVYPWRVPTESLYDAVKADQTESEVSHWFEIPLSAVRAAVGFEEERENEVLP